nr:MAG: ORF1 [Torque teno midi virus]
MPFWWQRRNRWWNKGRFTWRKRRRRYARKPRRRRRRPRYRRPYRRRRGRRNKVRRKKKKLVMTQWQPESIRKCKIKGFIFHCAGAQGKQCRCFSDVQYDWVPPRSPGGGGFGCEKFTLESLYKEHKLQHNIWTHSNIMLELVRYTGGKFTFFRHPHVDFIVQYSRNYPMSIDKYTYMECHPVKLLLSKHKIIIPSLLTKPHGKNFKKVKFKPPRQMTNKWFFQDQFADTGLLALKTAAADLRYSYLGCCNENTIITFFALNDQFYQQCGWGNDRLATNWYLPYAQCPRASYSLKQPNGTTVTQDMTSYTYKDSINQKKGWFSPAFLQCIQIVQPKEDVIPSIVGRYNPHIDNGEGNYIYLQSTLKMTYGKPLTDPDLILEGEPLWLMLYGFLDWVNKKKGDKTYIDSYVLVMQSPAILPKKSTQGFWVPIDKNFYLGKAPFDEILTPQMQDKWFPTVRYQQETINSIIMTGPFVPKFDPSIKKSTWELHSNYTFYFKWGGSQPPEQETADPKHQHSYLVPDKIKQAIQICDPGSQKAKSILHAWDIRRGLFTKSALKRMYEDLQSDANISTDTGESPQKKYKGTAMPVQENKEKEIQDCLLSLFEENTCQEQETSENLLQLIKQQQEQQQLLKLNLLHLISDLKKKQTTIQLQTGLLT